MDFEEYAAKPLLETAGIAIPGGEVAATPEEAAAAAGRLGACVVKAQVASGKRGKAGGIALAQNPAEAEAAAARILGMTIGDLRVERLLVEQQVDIARELYAAVMNDPESQSPLLLFSTEGGMDIEEVAETQPDRLLRLPIDIRHGLSEEAAREAIAGFDLARSTGPVADALVRLYKAYAENDAELVEINPLAVTGKDRVVALDCKFTLDDSAAPRQSELRQQGVPEPLTELETRGRALGLKYIEFDGPIGIIANGAGLTMTTMDAVRHYGGAPANFLEIGGDAYTLGKPALELALAHPKVRALLVNFCGAFARTDVMTEAIVDAWQELDPSIPVFFTIHGTGEAEAIAMVREQLNLEPYDLMDDAVKAAVAAAQ